MNPLLMFLLAITLPLVITTILLAPTYLGMLAALYFKYGNQVMPIAFDFSTAIDTYMKLFDYWWVHSDSLSFQEYALPIVGPLVIGVLITAFAMWKFAVYVTNIFVLSS